MVRAPAAQGYCYCLAAALTIGHALQAGGADGLQHHPLHELASIVLLKAVRQALGLQGSGSRGVGWA